MVSPRTIAWRRAQCTCCTAMAATIWKRLPVAPQLLELGLHSQSHCPSSRLLSEGACHDVNRFWSSAIFRAECQSSATSLAQEKICQVSFFELLASPGEGGSCIEHNTWSKVAPDGGRSSHGSWLMLLLASLVLLVVARVLLPFHSMQPSESPAMLTCCSTKVLQRLQEGIHDQQRARTRQSLVCGSLLWAPNQLGQLKYLSYAFWNGCFRGSISAPGARCAHAGHVFFSHSPPVPVFAPPHQALWSTFSPCLRIWPILCTQFLTMARVVVGSGGCHIWCC